MTRVPQQQGWHLNSDGECCHTVMFLPSGPARTSQRHRDQDRPQQQEDYQHRLARELHGKPAATRALMSGSACDMHGCMPAASWYVMVTRTRCTAQSTRQSAPKPVDTHAWLDSGHLIPPLMQVPTGTRAVTAPPLGSALKADSSAKSIVHYVMH